MTAANHNRREFLADSSRAAVGLLALPWLATLVSCAREDARNGDRYITLTPAEGRAMRAFAAQIIPSDDGTPGADEAGSVHFVDRALGTPFFAESLPAIQAGLADLDARARLLRTRDFASLGRSEQLIIMHQIEHDPFFAVARMLVVIGTFADPSYGGNRQRIGWTIVGIDHRPSYSAPYGWYDAQANADPPPNGS